MATCESSPPIEISGLILQLLAKEEDNLVAKDAEEIFNGGVFSNRVESMYRLIPRHRSCSIARNKQKKYTKLVQALIPNYIKFLTYSKVANLTNNWVSRPSINLYPNPGNLIGVHTPYFIRAQQALIRILSTTNYPKADHFPLTFCIADAFVSTGCHNVYNQHCTNTSTKSFLSASN